MAKAYILSPENEALLRREWPKADMLMPALCEALACSEKTVRDQARKLELGSRPQIITNVDWPPARVERLKALHKDGLSASRIAERINIEWPDADCTRNAVISKIVRLGLPSDPEKAKFNLRRNSPATAPKAEKPTAHHKNALNFRSPPKPKLAITETGQVFEVAPPAPEPPIRADAWRPLPGSTPVSLLQIEPRMCKWPVELGTIEHAFCALPADGGQYCPVHAKRAFVSSSRKASTRPDIAYVVDQHGHKRRVTA